MASSSPPSTALARRPKLTLVKRAINALTRLKPPTTHPFQRKPGPFARWGYDRIEEEIADAFMDQQIDVSLRVNIAPAPGQAVFMPRRSTTNPILVNRAFFQGDHWQNGDGWIGPHPELNATGYQDTMTEISNIFTSKNVIKEAVLRHALGVTGRNMQWGFTPTRELSAEEKPTPEEQTAMDEATKLMRSWLQSRKFQTMMRGAVCTLLLSERAALRITVPPGLADQDAEGNLVIHTSSIEEGLSFVYVEHPLPDNATVALDQDTKTEAGMWRYTATEEPEDSEVEGGAETADADGMGADVDYVAICFIDADGMTVTRIYTGGATSQDAESQAILDLGGRLPMFEMRRSALVSMQVQQGQRALNLAESMIPRTAVTSGFLERLLIDAQLPGEPEVDTAGNPTGRWISKPFYVGAGTTNFVQSTEYLDEDGKTKRANASVHFREPVAATGPIAASDKHYRAILDETGQLHVIMSGDANASGASRMSSRIEYLSTLQLTSGEVEAAWRFVIDTALATAEALANQPGAYTKLIRSTASCRLDAGPVSAPDRTAIEASIGITISQETAMALLNIEDIEAEQARMAEDPLARAKLGEAVGLALTTLTTPGASLEGAARFIGMDPDALKDLLTSPPPPPTIIAPPKLGPDGKPLPPEAIPPKAPGVKAPDVQPPKAPVPTSGPPSSKA